MKRKLIRKQSLGFVAIVFLTLLCSAAAFSQSSAFTYQGRLTDGGTAANGNYDFQFALWDSLSGGTQIGSTQTLNAVAVSNGVFTVSLDFGASSFTGANRFLEISARPSGAGSFTLLTPRQQVTSTPYAVRSASAGTADTATNSTNATTATNATQLGGVAAGQYVQTNDVRLSNQRDPTVGSPNYIQNTTNQQASTNFNISGTGTANIVNAATQFNINGNRILSMSGNQSFPNSNLFVGVGAGQADAGSSNNSFFGQGAGKSNTTGIFNSFFGANAGAANTTTNIVAGNFNSFFGANAGLANTIGFSNSFFGQDAGRSNTTGPGNSFFGNLAGSFNTTGQGNTFVGAATEIFSDNGKTGDNNTAIGFGAQIGRGGQPTLANATAIGANAIVTQSSSLILGSINSVNGAPDTNVGIGITAPAFRLHVIDPGAAGLRVQTNTSGGAVASFGGNGNFEIDSNGTTAGRFIVQQGGNVGIGTASPDNKLTVNGTADKPGGGSWGTFSDERLKNIKGSFTPGLRAIMRLQPLRYEYKRDNALGIKSEGEHVGFSAQAVQKIIPEAVTTNDKGYLLVNNDPILWTMLNAIKQQQAQIQQQRELIEQQRALANRQQQELNALKKLACRSHRRAGVCR